MKTMLYSLLADLVVTIHIGYVAYIIIGLALILVGLGRGWGWVRNPWFRLTHLAAILVVVLELFLKATCPLTLLEWKLRSLAGQPVTEAGFFDRLMHHVLSGWLPGSVTNSVYVVAALVISAAFVFAPPHWGRFQRS
ncbi:MAG: DUF2784 domain-containing protein [Acidobacteriota bacterium]|nr:DUF2784 domain-containing protein [Acidobacteriota bacterium]